ncbi:seminal plasma protein PDC-109 [Bubalus bubalis]|uniref:seminal plasma protein PDC-109 n=1 Tax=Bubalus bubalis TaxID=89462 RepID=UPI000DBC7552|nr:seminal plasma protein PDC-109 [Bubalus bubalis]XP_045019195.1 seminal plasma protein PDC-109 [Bubalus bubalis]
MALQLGLFLIWAGVSVFLQLDPVNGNQDEGVSTELTQDRPAELPEDSVPDEERVFPFTYRNRKHFDCTLRGSIFPWCSLDANYVGRWKYCAQRDYAKCVFPFIYGGKKYETCTKTGSMWMSWCSLSPNYDKDRAWKYC